MSKGGFLTLLFISFITIIVFSILEYLELSPGRYIDWILALGSFWWLMLITTGPWNMHFEAKSVLDDAALSTEKGMEVSAKDVEYAKKITKRYLQIAIALHFVTAGILFLVAYFDISQIGYVGAVVALLLTLLRPAVRMHEYIINKLSSIRKEIRYPREDVAKLYSRVQEVENQIKEHHYLLDLTNQNSTLSTQISINENQDKTLEKLELWLSKLEKENSLEHKALGSKAEEVILKFSEDAKFLHQVREILKYLKTHGGEK